jgi:hypothetical protein
MLRIDPEEGDEDGEAKPVKLKIDQNLFTYAGANKTPVKVPQNNSGDSVSGQDGVNQNRNAPVVNNSGAAGQQYHVIMPSPVKVCKNILNTQIGKHTSHSFKMKSTFFSRSSK